MSHHPWKEHARNFLWLLRGVSFKGRASDFKQPDLAYPCLDLLLVAQKPPVRCSQFKRREYDASGRSSGRSLCDTTRQIEA